MKTTTRKLLFILFTLAFISACKEDKKEEPKPEPGVYPISNDTADNQLWMELMNPTETLFFKANKYKESYAGYQDLMLSEFQLKDSSGDGQYRLRILTHLQPLDTGSYQTTDNNYNPYSDKVYVEFYRHGSSSKEKLFVSTLHQKDNYFDYFIDNKSKVLKFRILCKMSNPERYAVIKGRFRIEH